MTDLQRARQTLKRIERSLVAYPRPRGPLTYTANDVEDALAAARREGAEAERARHEGASEIIQRAAKLIKTDEEAAERRGAEEMRERAAQHCIDVIAGWTGRHMADAIRALPLTPEGPT